MRGEIRRTIERLTIPWPVKLPNVQSHADLRQAVAGLKHTIGLLGGIAAVTEPLKERLQYLEKLFRTPPERCDVVKYSCAREARDLVVMFCRDESTSFLAIAELLHGAVTREPGADLRDACRYVLEDVKRT
jgi:hypothetical protein